MYNNIGLSGWRNWIRRNIAFLSVVSYAIGCPELIGALIVLGSDDPNARMSVDTSYEPTVNEKNTIQSWYDKRFLPWYETLMKEYATVFETNDPAILKEEKIAVANSILRKIEAIDIHLQTKENSGLSADALLVRLELVGGYFDTITNRMRDELGDVHLELLPNQKNYSTSEFGTLVSDDSFLKMDFSAPIFVEGKGVDFVNETIVDPIVTEGPGSPKPTDPTVETNPKATPKNEIDPIEAVKSTSKKTAIIVGVSALAVWYLFKSKKSKK